MVGFDQSFQIDIHCFEWIASKSRRVAKYFPGRIDLIDMNYDLADMYRPLVIALNHTLFQEEVIQPVIEHDEAVTVSLQRCVRKKVHSFKACLSASSML